jgi:hypothetical protein
LKSRSRGRTNSVKVLRKSYILCPHPPSHEPEPRALITLLQPFNLSPIECFQCVLAASFSSFACEGSEHHYR